MFTTLGSKDIGIRKSEFVKKTQFLSVSRILIKFFLFKMLDIYLQLILIYDSNKQLKLIVAYSGVAVVLLPIYLNRV